MKAAWIVGALFVLVGVTDASAQFGGYGTGSNYRSHTVRPHFDSDGTFTQGHRRSNPNSTTLDNWSTRPNINPYTGQIGTRSPRPW
jgi:hypothetical protein